MKFSIVVLAYNIAPYIGECIRSLIDQTYSNFEAIVINDASTDNTLSEIMRAIGDDKRFMVVNAPANRGRHLSRKNGAQLATGDWVMFVDGDDSLKPHALEALAARIESMPEKTDMVYYWRDVHAQRDEDKVAAATLQKEYNHAPAVLHGDAIVESAFSDNPDRVLWTVISLAVRRDVSSAAWCAMADERLDRLEDAYEFFVLCDRAQNLVITDDQLLTYEWGRGITGLARESLTTFTRNAKAVLRVLRESSRYARTRDTGECDAAVRWMTRCFARHVSTEQVLRGNPATQREAFLAFSRLWGTDIAVGELNRLIIDRARSLTASLQAESSAAMPSATKSSPDEPSPNAPLSNVSLPAALPQNSLKGTDDEELMRLCDIRAFLLLTHTPAPEDIPVPKVHLAALRAQADEAISELKKSVHAVNFTRLTEAKQSTDASEPAQAMETVQSVEEAQSTEKKQPADAVNKTKQGNAANSSTAHNETSHKTLAGTNSGGIAMPSKTLSQNGNQSAHTEAVDARNKKPDIHNGTSDSVKDVSTARSARRTSIDPDSTNRLAIFCFYDGKGHAASYIRFFLDDLMRNIRELIVVVNGKLDKESEALFRTYTDTIIIRDNVGLDVAAYKQALLSVGWEKLETFDEVICLNDTVLGPVFPFREMFRTMSARAVDFWGITAYAGETVGDEEIPTHIQAYWHVYRRSLVSSQAFHEYWETMPLWTDYAEVTRKHEMRFTPYFEKLGFTWSTYVDWRKYAGMSSYPLLYMPAALLRDDQCPVFKRRSFYLPYDFTFDQTAGQPAVDLYDYVRDHTTYNTDLIWDSVLPVYNIADIQRAMHLDYVLPAEADNPEPAHMPRAAFIYHVFFLDLLDDTMRYIEQLPDEVDLYITTTPDKFADISDAFVSRGLTRQPQFIPVVNRGRDVSALLVAAKDVVLNGGYDVIGFAHDKKSSQNQQSGHHGTETQGFAYKLMENTLGSTTYVRNILRMFGSNPRLGLLCPPPPYHALYFAHTLPVDWGPNFGITKELLEDRLDIHVNLDSSKPTVSAIGSCYWFRVDALRPLFEAGWTYEDFLPEGQMGGDGSISHAIERANGYVVQSQGYYPAWVMSDRYARIEVDSLYYVTGALLRGMGPFRRGETVLQTANALGMQLSRQGRVVRGVRRKTHLALKWVTRHFVQPLPKPLRDALYNAAWWPINMVRRAKNAVVNRKR